FMDGFNAVGLIPASLVRWEMTGKQSDEMKRMLDLRRGNAASESGPAKPGRVPRKESSSRIRAAHNRKKK
ncbi:MAG TPA: hypothetical protein VFA98_00355, partial [Thermoanaerobaculia bacterium]|nr:hypothetical protein [Thermoanaerobaculia bacterium]